MLCLTGQHDSLIEDVMTSLDIKADITLKPDLDQASLSQKMTAIVDVLQTAIDETNPDLIMVHGDTLSSYCGSVTAFLNKIPLAHVEAGLRTHNKFSPYPEEMIRRQIALMADQHFAPTTQAMQNLIDEGVDKGSIHLTGNTVIDALEYISSVPLKEYDSVKVLDDFIEVHKQQQGKKLLLLTMHRRENMHGHMQKIMDQIIDAVKQYDLALVYIRHPNPNVKVDLEAISREDNVFVSGPVSYPQFVQLMKQADLVLTDSGGIQEEAPFLGIPVLVLRNETERTEALDGTRYRLYDPENIQSDIRSILESEKEVKDVYGDGRASERIVQILEKLYS